MTPERIEEIKREYSEPQKWAGDPAVVNELLAALEEAEQQNVQLSMNNLNLQAEIESVQIDNGHLRKSIDWWDNYSRDKNEDLIEAQQTIARQREALEFYAKTENYETKVDGNRWGPWEEISDDKGNRARVALEENKKER